MLHFCDANVACTADAFLAWQRYATTTEVVAVRGSLLELSNSCNQVLPIGKIIGNSVVNKPSKEVLAAYSAPYPEPKYQAGAKAFPALVPTSPKDPAAPANKKVLLLCIVVEA